MQHLRKLLVLLFLLMAVALIPACGKKGPLYLPVPTPPPAPAAKPAQTPAPKATPTPPPSN